MKRPILLGCLLVAIFGGASGGASDRNTLWEAPRAKWEPVFSMPDSLFPSAIIATANVHLPKSSSTDVAKGGAVTLGDPLGWLGVLVVAPTNETRVHVKIRCRALMEESEGDYVLPLAGRTYRLHPDIAWDFDALRRIPGAQPQTVTFEVTVSDGQTETKTKRALVRSINDCLTGTVENGRFVCIPIIFPAYVNEDHPWVSQILNEAKKSGTIRTFVGYQANNPQEVYRQVYAIWNVMQRRGLTYSSIATEAANSSLVRSQEVRFLEQSIATTQANCVDGSVLFASILRKIGLEPFLVQIPGHMFVGFYLDAAKRSPAALETTMMGMVDLRRFSEDRTLTATLNQMLGADTKNSASWKTFVAAVAEGNREFNVSMLHINRRERDYALIDISAARRMGILPIAYSK